MTDDAIFLSLLPRRATSQVLHFLPRALAQLPMTPPPARVSRWTYEQDSELTQPMLFRSEAFAEDLCDMYPSP